MSGATTSAPYCRLLVTTQLLLITYHKKRQETNQGKYHPARRVVAEGTAHTYLRSYKMYDSPVGAPFSYLSAVTFIRNAPGSTFVTTYSISAEPWNLMVSPFLTLFNRFFSLQGIALTVMSSLCFSRSKSKIQLKSSDSIVRTLITLFYVKAWRANHIVRSLTFSMKLPMSIVNTV